MLNLGALGAVTFTFDDAGNLSALNVHRHGRRLPLSESLPASLTKSRRAAPVFAPEEFPQAKTFALETHGRRLVQELQGGQRTWDVYQSRADAREASLAWARVTHTLDAAADWRLTVDDCLASVQQSEGHLIVQCSDHVALRISSPLPMTYETKSAKDQITGATVTVKLPAGESAVEIVVESRPPYDLADTLIICMPQQLAEAAVVATCIRGKAANAGKYVPVIDVLNPPVAPDEYRQATESMQASAVELQQTETEIMRLAGAAAGAPGAAATPEIILPTGGIARSEDKVKELLKRQEELQSSLSEQQSKVLSFAAWQRRWERVVRLVVSFQPAQVVFLYPVPPDLAAAVSPAPGRLFFFWEDFRAQVGEWEKALAAKTPDQPPAIAYFGDLEILAKMAWERLSGRPYEGAFTIPDDPRYYALGVRRALQTGKPLLPKGRAGQKVNLEAATEQANQGATSEETVIVEADGTLSSLAAALYADYLNAPLLVHPATNPQDVVTKLSAIQQQIEKEELAKQSSAAYAYIGEHKSRFLQDPKVTQEMRTMAASIPVIELPRSMPTPYSAQAFVQMLSVYANAKQQGVTSGYKYELTAWEQDARDLTGLVTARVDGIVRARMLKRQRATVFTVGVPYTFVDGWRDKTVSHVMVEPCLTVLRHVLNRSLVPPAAAFTVVFDSGVTRAVESPTVARRLRRGRTYPLYLREAAANSGALQTYPALLPVEGIFLDTLGDESSVFLTDQRRGLKPFSAAEIELTCDLAYAPLVFSHIAFSWLAVGTAFLSAGAREYVGTLWSVEAEPGDEMALRTLGGPAEDAVAVDEMTRRAYLHMGLLDGAANPAAQAEPPAGDLPNTAARQSLYSAMLFLAEAGLHEQADPLYRQWEALGQEDLAAADDDAGRAKDEMDAEEREYHRRDTLGRQKRANGQAEALTAQPGAASPDLLAGEPPAPKGPDKPLFYVP